MGKTKEEDISDVVARLAFRITLIGCVLYGLSVIIFVY